MQLFLHVLKGAQTGSYIQLSDNSTYHVANNFDADIYLETENNEPVNFTINVLANTFTFTKIDCEIIADDNRTINIEQHYATPLKCSIAGILTLYFSDSAVVESYLNNPDVEINELTNLSNINQESLDFVPVNDEPNNEEILAEVRQKILDRSFYLKCWDKLRLYFYQFKQKLGYWLYLVSLGLTILFLAVIIIIYQVYQQGNVTTMEESRFSFKHKIEQQIQSLPSKFNNLYVTSQDGNFIINGIVNNQSDLKQVNQYFESYQSELKIKVVAFESIKDPIAKILAENNILMGKVSFDINTATVNLMGLTDSMGDIDNAEIAIDNMYPGVGQMSANRVFLTKDINATIDEIFNSTLLSQSLTISKDFTRGIITVSGYLAPSDINNLNSAVAAFNQKYYPLIQIKTDIKNVFNSLPFKITEVYSGGDQSWIVTDDGTRIFEGGSYKGFSVLSISNESIVLKGKFTLTINTSQLALDNNFNNITSEIILKQAESTVIESKEITNLLGTLNESSNSY